MEHWPGQERAQTTKHKGKHKEHRADPTFWQWPHLDYGSIGSATLVTKDGKARWSTLVDTSHKPRWLPLGKPAKVFPETRPPQYDLHEHSARQRAEKGLQYLRAYFPDADFPDEMLGNALEAETREMRSLGTFDPLLGNLLDIIPSHRGQNEYLVVFPMDELGRELNVSRLSPDGNEHMVFNPTGSPSFTFETPILQLSSAVGPSQWISAPSTLLLVRTHSSSSLARLEYSEVTRELDITRSETGDVPIADSKILASGPDIVVVNRSGHVYKCNTYHGGKAMRFIGSHEVSDDDSFWQLGVTARDDECFLASCKTVRHIDFRSANATTDIYSAEKSSTIVTSFESPTHGYISRISTTSDLIWLDDRFRRRPLLSFKHYRSFDRTLRVLTANLGGASLSLLTSRRHGLVTLYDVSRGTDSLLHCNSKPSCLPQTEPIFTAYGGHALIAHPSDVKLTFLRLGQRGSVHRQDIRVARPGEDLSGSVQDDHVTHHWDEDVLKLEKQACELQIDLGPAGGRHFTEVNFRDAYEKMFAIADDTEKDTDRNTFKNTLARLPDVWQDVEENAKHMLTTFDVISGDKRPLHATVENTNRTQAFGALMCGEPATQKLAELARWHYDIQDTSIPGHGYSFVGPAALHESLKELNLEPKVERPEPAVRRETVAREQLVVDLSLSKNVYSALPFTKYDHLGASEGAMAHPKEVSYSEEPPEIKFGYFRPVRKAGADHYAGKEQVAGWGADISSPLGVRLLLAEWEVGTDPDDYTYRDPYGVGDAETQPIPQYRKLPAAATRQKKQVPPQQPPAVQSQTMHSQQDEGGIDGASQGLVTSTQVVAGPFGGRRGTRKKGGKKRIGGF